MGAICLLPIKDFVCHKPRDLMPACRCAAVKIAFEQRAVHARWIDGHARVAPQQDAVGAFFDIDGFGRFGDRETEYHDIPFLDIPNLGVSPLPAEAAGLCVDRASSLLRRYAFGDSHRKLQWLLDGYIDLAGVRNVAVDIRPLGCTIQKQVDLQTTLGERQDVFPEVLNGAGPISGAAVDNP